MDLLKAMQQVEEEQREDLLIIDLCICVDIAVRNGMSKDKVKEVVTNFNNAVNKEL